MLAYAIEMSICELSKMLESCTFKNSDCDPMVGVSL